LPVRTALLAVSLASAYASGTHAQGAPGGSLVELCNSESQTDNLVCTALIIGTTSGMRYGVDAGAMAMGADVENLHIIGHEILKACTPRDATGGQLQAIALKFLRAHPEFWHEHSPAIVHRALTKTFPC